MIAKVPKYIHATARIIPVAYASAVFPRNCERHTCAYPSSRRMERAAASVFVICLNLADITDGLIKRCSRNSVYSRTALKKHPEHVRFDKDMLRNEVRHLN